jgi:hypothetical protein
LKPDINYNFPTATFNENFKSGFSVAGLWSTNFFHVQNRKI